MEYRGSNDRRTNAKTYRYQQYLALVSAIDNSLCTRTRLEALQHGFFRNKIKHYLDVKITCTTYDHDTHEEMFGLTPLGLKLWRQEITIEDVIKV